MAETQRTIAELQTLLADNSVGAISPTDIRDLMETLRPGHGQIYITATAATSFTDTTSFVFTAGTYTLSSVAYNWDMNTNGQLRYTGAADRLVHVIASVSKSSNTNNEVVEWAIAKNGTALTESIQSEKIGTGADIASTALQAFTSVSTNDYLTVVVKNKSWTAAETITAEYLNLFAIDLPSAS